MRGPKHREDKLAQSHTAAKWKNQNSNQAAWIQSPCSDTDTKTTKQNKTIFYYSARKSNKPLPYAIRVNLKKQYTEQNKI